MFNIGDKVTFFSLNEEFDEINSIDNYVETRGYYIIKEFDGTNMSVKSTEASKTINIDNVFNEYQVFTAETLKAHLTSLNHAHIAICNKIKQLYRKQNFQFKGIYQ